MQQCLPFTVLKPVTQFDIFKWHKSCNSAYRLRYWNIKFFLRMKHIVSCNSAYRLRYWNFRIEVSRYISTNELQQCLPFTVLKLNDCFIISVSNDDSCNSAYRLRYWNYNTSPSFNSPCCNSAYRLRYWNSPKPRIRPFSTSFGVLQQYLPFTVLKLAYHECYSRFLWVATVLTVYGIETIELACRYENGF